MNKTLKTYKLIAELQHLIEGDEELQGIVKNELFEQEEPGKGPVFPADYPPETQSLTKEQQDIIDSICDSWGD